MLLSGCKGNTFFWKSTFFYGLICVQSEKTQKTACFISQQADLMEDQKQSKRAYFITKRNRIVGIFAEKIHPFPHCFRHDFHRLSYSS